MTKLQGLENVNKFQNPFHHPVATTVFWIGVAANKSKKKNSFTCGAHTHYLMVKTLCQGFKQ